jgi:DNA-binding NtrC family response regulator
MADVLVVDDDENQAHSLALGLRLEGIDASAAVGAEAALALLRVEPARVVVCDLRMRGKNGLELAGELEAIYPGTKVLLTSGFPMSDAQVKRCGCHAIVGFVPKPCDLVGLAGLIRRIDIEPRGPLAEAATLLAASGDHESAARKAIS